MDTLPNSELSKISQKALPLSRAEAPRKGGASQTFLAKLSDFPAHLRRKPKDSSTDEVLDRRRRSFRLSPARQDRDPARAERRLEAHGKQHQGEAAGGRGVGEGGTRDRAGQPTA